jgi:hypothetical protein
VSGQPDPKADPRIIDRDATKRTLVMYPECLACGGPASNGHHVLPVGRGQTGDDVSANIIGYCGTGTMGCHGSFHGNPYTVSGRRYDPKTQLWLMGVERRDREWVTRRTGERLPDERPDVIEYVLDKLGDEPGRAYLERVYYLIVEAA